MKNITFKIIGVITALPGFYYLIKEFRSYIFSISEIFKGNINSEYMPWWMTAITLLMIIILVLRIVSGYGLFRLKAWGKKIAVSVLSIDLAIRFAGFINFWTYHYRYPEAQQLIEKMENSLSAGQKEVSLTISMIPSYLIASVAILSIILLLYIDFNKLKTTEHNQALNADG